MIQIGINIAVKGTGVSGLPPAPVNSSPPVISGTTTLGSVLTTTNGTWTNSPSSFAYQWKRGVTNIGTNSNTYTLVVADSGAAITCMVTAINTGGSSNAISNIITAQTYSSPTNTILPVISGNTTIVGSILTTTDGTWIGNPAPSLFSYQWKRGVTNIGTNSANYTSVFADANASITCVVTATNAVGSGSVSSNTLIMGTFFLANTVAPVISGTPTSGSVLTTTNGTWTNSPSSFSYQWKRGATNIGTGASTYTLVVADEAQNITCVVTATNAVGSDNATSNSLYIYDLDAYTFITNAVITNSTEQTAINNLVIGLKSDSLWTSMLAIYPFVGDTASQQKFNLKNPLDTNAAFRLSFQGGWTHTSSGALPNGTTGYANTFFTPSTSGWALGNSSISAYSRTNNVMASGVIYGVRGGATSTTYPVLNVSSTSNFHNSGVVNSPSPLPTSTACNFISSRINTTNVIMAINGTATSYASLENTLASLAIGLAARRNVASIDLYSTRQLAFAHIGTGLTTGQCTQLYTRIQAFQTTLGRANP